MEVGETKTVKDGEHDGEITNAQERAVQNGNEEYTYIDFFIRIMPEDVTLRYGCPEMIKVNQEGKPNTMLAKFLHTMGFELKKGSDVTFEKIKMELTGKKVKVKTKNETSERGTFAQIKEIEKA